MIYSKDFKTCSILIKGKCEIIHCLFENFLCELVWQKYNGQLVIS